MVPPGDRLEVDPQGNLRIRVARTTSLEPVVPAGLDLARAVARIEADPVGLEIMWSRLINIVEECWLTVWRTAFSLIIGEAQDFACELLDPRGNSLAHSPRAMPVFNLTLPRAVRAILERFPAETLVPGDILITNDPWICAGHLFDVAIVTPVFRDGRVVAILGTIGHVTDIGGTRDSLQRARDLRGGVPDPADEALPGRGAERGPLPAPGRERPQERAGAGATSTPSSRPTPRAPSVSWPSWPSTGWRTWKPWPR